MAKGMIAKNEVMNKILKFFGNKAFLYNDGKEIRINWVENAEPCQIKLTFTASKVAVAPDGEEVTETMTPAMSENIETLPTEPTAEEKQSILELMKRIGL